MQAAAQQQTFDVLRKSSRSTAVSLADCRKLSPVYSSCEQDGAGRRAGKAIHSTRAAGDLSDYETRPISWPQQQSGSTMLQFVFVWHPGF